MKNTITNTVTITPLGENRLAGIIQAAASKSSMQRACAAAFVARGTSVIRNPGYSNDDKAALDIIRRLGAIVEVTDDLVTVQSSAYSKAASAAEKIMLHSAGQKSEPIEINCGESGLSIRMFTPLAALSNQEIINRLGIENLMNRLFQLFWVEGVLLFSTVISLYCYRQ